jgi:hypothetical protein
MILERRTTSAVGRSRMVNFISMMECAFANERTGGRRRDRRRRRGGGGGGVAGESVEINVRRCRFGLE